MPRLLWGAIVVGTIMFAYIPKAAAAKLIYPNISAHLGPMSLVRIECVKVCDLSSNIPCIYSVLSIANYGRGEFASKQDDVLFWSEESWRIISSFQPSFLEWISTSCDCAFVRAIKFNSNVVCGCISTIDDDCFYGDCDRPIPGVGFELQGIKINNCSVDFLISFFTLAQRTQLKSAYNYKEASIDHEPASESANWLSFIKPPWPLKPYFVMAICVHVAGFKFLFGPHRNPNPGATLFFWRRQVIADRMLTRSQIWLANTNWQIHLGREIICRACCQSSTDINGAASPPAPLPPPFGWSPFPAIAGQEENVSPAPYPAPPTDRADRADWYTSASRRPRASATSPWAGPSKARRRCRRGRADRAPR
jgi:hypothetical protein